VISERLECRKFKERIVATNAVVTIINACPLGNVAKKRNYLQFRYITAESLIGPCK
jgi:hypothetical protein